MLVEFSKNTTEIKDESYQKTDRDKRIQYLSFTIFSSAYGQEFLKILLEDCILNADIPRTCDPYSVGFISGRNALIRQLTSWSKTGNHHGEKENV